MTPEKAFELINNLDIREPLRKFSFRYSTVTISAQGEIVDVVRYKEQPTHQMDLDNLKKYPNCFQFPSWPGRFSSVEELVSWIREGVRLNRVY